MSQKGNIVLPLIVLIVIVLSLGAVGYFLVSPTQNQNTAEIYNNLPADTQNKSDDFVAYFTTVDKNGLPFKPNRAWWYYPPIDERAEEYPAVCINDGCTKWGVPGPVSGETIYVGAESNRKHASSSCFYGSYDALPIDLQNGATNGAVLVLEERESCY